MSKDKTRQRLKRTAAGREGQMLAVVACVMVAMIGMLGLITDTGLLEANRRHAQRAADVAAQAGARELLTGFFSANQANAGSAASDFAVQNGTAPENVAVEIPPASSAYYNGSNNCVRVRVGRPTNTTFMRLLLPVHTVNVPAAATAAVVRRPVPYTVMALDPSMPAALKVGGNGNLRVLGGSVYVDSSDSVAVSIDGSNATIITPELNVVGGIDYPEKVVGTVNLGAGSEPDPFATVVWPQIISTTEARLPDGTTITTSLDTGGTATKPATRVINNTITLRPGIYWGGLKITGGTVTLLPGIYFMAGGGFEVSSNPTVTSNGQGVMIYNSRDPYKLSGQYAGASIDLTGGAVLNLVAPDSGFYKGFLLVNDALNPHVVKLAGQAISGNEMPLKGFIYNPNGELQIEGGAGSAGLGAVCKSIKINGGGTLGVLDSTRVPDMPMVRLVE